MCVGGLAWAGQGAVVWWGAVTLVAAAQGRVEQTRPSPGIRRCGDPKARACQQAGRSS